MPIETHQISLLGVSGGIFWTAAVAVIFYVIGFISTGWELTRHGTTWIGLWQVCSSDQVVYRDDWFKATQAMITIGLILLVLSFIMIFFYMFLHSMNKSTLIKVFVIFTFVAVVAMVTGFIIFGTKHEYLLSWSYFFCVIGAGFCFVSGILSIVQMRRANIC